MKKFIFSAPLTHSDWMLHDNTPAWGEEGVRTMLVQCKKFGFSRIYWRVFDAGKATYFSKLADPMIYTQADKPSHNDPDWIGVADELVERYKVLDYTKFDTLEAAVRIGHELGLEIYAWLTVNEDDHGFGYASRFAKANPEYLWTHRDGRKFHSQMSFAFPKVCEYKLGLIKELLAYDVDGLFLDWMRTGDIRDNPHSDGNGVAEYGYEMPCIEAFESKYGVSPFSVENGDERWVACRAEPRTKFMRDVRALTNKRGKKTKILVMTAPTGSYRGTQPETWDDKTPEWIRKMGFCKIDGSLRGLLCDIKTWAREGLMDSIVLGGYYMPRFNIETAYRYLMEETEGRIETFLYYWVPWSEKEVISDTDTARALGARELLFWEADYIHNMKESERREVIKAIQSRK